MRGDAISGMREAIGCHWKHSLWIVATLALLTLLGMNVLYDTSMVGDLVIIVGFSLLMAASFVLALRLKAAQRPQKAAKVFLLHATVRTLLAAGVIAAYWFFKVAPDGADKKVMLGFVILFAAFFLPLLVFDAFKVMRWQKTYPTTP